MARIGVQHEDLSFYEDEVADYNEFIKMHQANINKFKDLAQEVFTDFKGEIVFDYITKYHQFDLVQYSDDLTEEEINAGMNLIMKNYPDCFIANINTKPSVKG